MAICNGLSVRKLSIACVSTASDSLWLSNNFLMFTLSPAKHKTSTALDKTLFQPNNVDVFPIFLFLHKYICCGYTMELLYYLTTFLFFLRNQKSYYLAILLTWNYDYTICLFRTKHFFNKGLLILFLLHLKKQTYVLGIK